MHFDPTKPEKILFTDAAANVLKSTDPLVGQLERKVFVRMSEKYKSFAMQCKDIKTPLGRLIPDSMKPKMFKVLADKLHKPITFVEKYTVGEVIEGFEHFADAPSFKNFILAIGGGGGFNTMLLTGVLMMDVGNNKWDELSTDYIKYVL